MWSILRFLHPVKMSSSRINDLQKYGNELNFENIEFPMKLRDIDKFEKQNPTIPGINVFSVNENINFYPLRQTMKTDFNETIDLFLSGKDGKFHYSLIKNFSRLISS